MKPPMPDSSGDSTGLPALDRVLNGVLPGDNIVWQVDTLEDYRVFVRPYVEEALRRGKSVHYFRFSRHKEVVPRDLKGVVVHKLDPKVGFENFIIQIRHIIEHNGLGAYYVFDSHTELAGEAYSDRLLGNFFLLTCPYLYELKTVTYFGVLRKHHTYNAAAPMVVTTQVLIDVYRNRDRLFIHPLKVEGRFSPTMFTLHAWDGDDFTPVTKSAVISDILTSASWPGLQSASYRQLGQWDNWFMQAEEILEEYKGGECAKKLVDASFHHLLPPLISDDKRIQEMAKKYLHLEDLIYIWKRMIGSGRLGGKSIGMLLARAILQKRRPRWKELLEAHDSFYIGSDVFYTFLIMNDCWVVRQKQRNPATYLDGVDEAQERMRKGRFPDYIIRRFSDMLDYFGQSPIIVRSSSLLEDAFGNAFAGQYESVFCPNQGTHEKRLEAFLDAVRVVYSTAMSRGALTYRAKRGILESDEQMSLLVQRVAGEPHGRYFFPHLAGVAFSYNPYVWNESIDPDAGMMRLVLGLGTRAVDRADDDYTRVIALNAPDKRPEANFSQVKKYAQRRVDLLDLEQNAFSSAYFVDIVRECPGFPASKFAIVDDEMDYSRSGRESTLKPWVLTFDSFLENTDFVKDIREMLTTLRHAYGRHVDVEFTANLLEDGSYRINLLQCRPLQVKGTIEAGKIEAPHVEKKNVILESHGGVVGHSRVLVVDRLIHVLPEVYSRLPESERYEVARVIGRINGHDSSVGLCRMLVGPGRWGTHMPSLGVPVSFSEISSVAVMCEIDTMHEGLVPDLSLGTHFFNEMVEANMLYIAHFSARRENRFHEALLRAAPNRLAELLPEDARWSRGIRVVDSRDFSAGLKLYLNADALKQSAVLYLSPGRVADGPSGGAKVPRRKTRP